MRALLRTEIVAERSRASALPTLVLGHLREQHPHTLRALRRAWTLQSGRDPPGGTTHPPRPWHPL
jgi:hypothetical protein